MPRPSRGLLLGPFAVLLALLALCAADPAPLQEARLKVFDLYQRAAPRLYSASSDVAVIDIDDESLARLGQWPWPRTRAAELIQKLQEAQASVIVLDILFAEPDRTSPLAVMAQWPQGISPDLRSAIANLPDHDQLLSQALAGSKVVTGFSFIPTPTSRLPAAKAGWAHKGQDPGLFVPEMPGAALNLPQIESAASGNGHFNVVADPDGILRRVPLFFRHQSNLYPSIAAEAVRLHEGAGSYLIDAVPTGIERVKIGRRIIPTDSQGGVWLYDTGPVNGRRIAAWKILSGDFHPKQVQGKILFVGTSAAGLKDIRATPLDPVASGVEVHAQLAEQILTGTFLNRPDWSKGAEFLFLLVFGLLLMLLLPVVGPLVCAVLAVLAIALAWACSWAAFASRGWLLDPITPSISALAIYLVSSLTHFLKSERERLRVRRAFSRYMSPELVKRLAEHPELLKLGGEQKEMTLLFVDVRNFTSISERLDASELTQFVNRFLTPMTEVVLKHSGTIDKYIGDCVMAFWNAPLDDPQHALHACQAALEMRKALAEFNAKRKEEALEKGTRWETVQIGIGVETGQCCVGNLGSEQRFDYSVLGDTVNLASRLEGQSKTYGVEIILGPSAWGGASSLAALELDLIAVKGKSQPVKIYALLGDPSLAQDPRFKELAQAHAQMLEAYRRKEWDKAAELLKECVGLDTGTTRLRSFYDLYRQRVRHFKQNPPGVDWNGLYVADSK